MSDNNNNEPDGDLFGTHAAWEVPSSEVVRDWPSESEAAQILDFDALNRGYGAQVEQINGSTFVFTRVVAEPVRGFETNLVIMPTDDPAPVDWAADAAEVEGNFEMHSPSQGEPGYEAHSGIRASVPIPGVEFAPHPDQTSPASVSYEQFAEASDFAQGGEVVVDDHVAVEESDDAKQRRIADEVQTWLEAKEKSVAAVDTEREARKTVSATLFPNPVKGTQRVPIGANGQHIKLVHGWNYTIGDKDKVSEQGVKIPIYDQVAELEAKIAALGSEGSLLAPRLIKWTPSLVETEYLRLVRDDATDIEVQAKELIDAMLTVSEATPQLTFEEPKTKK